MSQSNSPIADAFQVSLNQFAKFIPYVTLLALVYAALSFSPQFINIKSQGYIYVLFLVGWLLWIPLLGGYIHFHGNILSKGQANIGASLALGFSRLLPIYNALVGILLLPSLLIGVSALIGFMSIGRGQTAIIYPLVVINVLFLIWSLNRNLMSFVLVCFEDDMYQSIQERYQELMKGQQLKTLFKSTLACLVWLTLISLPLWIGFVVELPETMQWVIVAVACFDVWFFTPMLFAFILGDLNRLTEGHQNNEPAPSKASETKAVQPKVLEPEQEPDHKKQLKDDEWF